MISPRLASALVALVAIVSHTLAQVPAAPVASPAELLSPRIEREIEKQKIVGLAVAIAEGDRIVFTGAFGFEDREQHIATTDGTMFRWASVSKPMTAVAAMQLSAEGKLDLDADVRELVPEFPEKPFKITTRQLLCHQGGIVHYSNGPVIATKAEYTDPHPFKEVVTALDTFKESPLVCEPGDAHNYTTHGYILLGAAVQSAAKEKFAAFVNRRIAEPLMMTTLRPDYQWEVIPHRAKGYRREKSGEVVPSTDTDVSWKLPGGGWISTATDMARFGAGMLGTKLVSAEVREVMWTPTAARDGKDTGYGLGFGIRGEGDEREISHSGAQEKTATFLLIVPGKGTGNVGEGGGLAVAVMCNTEGTRLVDLARDLAKLMAARARAASTGNP